MTSAALAAIDRGGALQRDRAYAGFAPLYDAAMGDAAYPAIRAAFDRACRRHRVRIGLMADVGCGTGRFLRGLPASASRYGVDRSPHMLRLARRRLAGQDVTLVLQDARGLRLPRRVDLITLNFAVLNYMTSLASLRALLAACSRNLKPQGWLIGDVLTGAGPVQMGDRTVQVVTLPGVRSVWRILIDRRRGLTQTDMRTKLPHCRLITERHRQRWWPLTGLASTLIGAGFHLEEASDMATGTRDAGHSHWIQIVARKLP